MCTDVGLGGLERSVLACVLSALVGVVSYGSGQPSGGLALGEMGSVYKHVDHNNGSSGEISLSNCLGLWIIRSMYAHMMGGMRTGGRCDCMACVCAFE